MVKVKVVKQFIGQKNERVNKDNSVIPKGTTLEVPADRAEALIGFGYVRKISEKKYDKKVVIPDRDKK